MDKSKEMMLSVIIPVYNAENYLHKCLDSIREQTFTDYEVILVNDGSSDGSSLICEEYSKVDSRFRLINQKNAGPGAARNRGLEEANGKYVCFIDSDDWVGPGYFASFMDEKYDDVDAVFWGYTENRAKETIVRGLDAAKGNEEECLQIILSMKKKNMFGFMIGCRFKSSIIQSHNMSFHTDIKVLEDACFINGYCNYISDIALTDNVEYHYMVYSETSLSRRFFSSDEMFKVACYYKEATSCWFTNEKVGYFDIYTYLSKLNASVMNMYDKQDCPQKSYSEKLRRIAIAKTEMQRYYSMLRNNIKTTHKIFRYLPVRLIDLIYRFK